jgi:predicted Zn-dependent protease
VNFAWKVYIMQDDATLNAFAIPSGYMYFCTDFIEYLANEDDLMGVMGHKMAHSDKNHSVQQPHQHCSVNLLLSIAFGNEPNQAAQILTSLGSLTFSRNAETEADEESVKYLAKIPIVVMKLQHSLKS